ncbi:MAG: 2-oxo acid dehydrogenase subunit E2 [Actinotalea sp.]|nr:2-oxo acid dehydrogenase subunit E2 [Actinotalea sp.]
MAPEGARVAVGDVLAEIETEKAVVELAAEEAGVLVRRLAAEGATVEVGAPVAVLGEAGEDVDVAALLGTAAALASEAQGSADDAAAVGGAAQLAGVAQKAAGQVVSSAPAAEGGAAAERLFASPIARKMAREADLDLARLQGSGPGGRIVRRDVEAAIAAGASAPAEATAAAAPTAPAAPAAPSAAPAAAAPAAGTRVPHTPMRRAIARRLTESKATVPHFYVVAEPRVDALLELRRQVNGSGDLRVSVNDLVVKAVAAAYWAVPEANVQWGEDAMTVLDGVDVAIAVATDGGLVTPVLRGVDRLPVSEVASRSADLVARARAGRLKQAELEGGSITVSNLGMYGTPEFSAILNPPQSAILAVGAALQQPVVVDGALTVGTVMRCVLSADHRAVDGALAARWAAAFTEVVENPLAILL